jgi:hypothetical protein
MKKCLFERFDSDQITNAMLQAASILFNENYGIWPTKPIEPQRCGKPGITRPLKMMLDSLTKQGQVRQ